MPYTFGSTTSYRFQYSWPSLFATCFFGSFTMLACSLRDFHLCQAHAIFRRFCKTIPLAFCQPQRIMDGYEYLPTRASPFVLDAHQCLPINRPLPFIQASAEVSSKTGRPEWAYVCHTRTSERDWRWGGRSAGAGARPTWQPRLCIRAARPAPFLFSAALTAASTLSEYLVPGQTDANRGRMDAPRTQPLDPFKNDGHTRQTAPIHATINTEDRYVSTVNRHVRR